MALISFRNFDPLDDLLVLQRELDRFLRNPRWFDPGPSGGGVFPPINVFDDEEGMVIRAEVPGLDPESLSINVERRTLTLSGERKLEKRAGGSFHRRERSFGAFSRSLRLPDGLDPSRATANCRNGVLTIHIPKAEEAKPRQIKIQAAT